MTQNPLQPSGSDDDIQLEQYAAILRAAVGHSEQLQERGFFSGLHWIIQCVSGCYESESSSPDMGRALDMVTALSWMFDRLVSTLDDGPEAVRRFIAEVKEHDLPELEAQTSVPRPKIDMDAIHAVAELDFDMSEMRLAAECGMFDEFLRSELDIAASLELLDDPGFLDRLAEPRDEGER